MGHLCDDGEEHVATDLLPLAEAGMEAMEPDVGQLCALLGEDRVDDDEYENAEGHVIGDSRQ
eukprot:1612971-Pleurochrysis_carterae.AAC.1